MLGFESCLATWPQACQDLCLILRVPLFETGASDSPLHSDLFLEERRTSRGLKSTWQSLQFHSLGPG